MVLLEGLHLITKDTSFWVFGLIWSDVKHIWVSGHDPSRVYTVESASDVS